MSETGKTVMAYKILPLERVSCTHCNGSGQKPKLLRRPSGMRYSDMTVCTLCRGAGQLVKITEFYAPDNPNIPLLWEDGNEVEHVECDFCGRYACVDSKSTEDGRIICSLCLARSRVLPAASKAVAAPRRRFASQ